MKKLTLSLILLLLISLITGCAKTVPNSPPSTGNSDLALNHAQVLEAIKGEIKTDLEVKLPQELPLLESEYLTAVIKSDNNSYSVVFYKNNEPMQLNSEELLNSSSSAIEIASLQVSKKASQQESDDEISFQDFSSIGGEEVDLGYNIKGYQDAGAGSVFTSWNEGRWALATRTLTSESDKGVELAKRSVEYLEKNHLPAPKQNGTIHLDTEGNGNLAKWQDVEVVYILDQVKEPLDMLKILVSFK